jgi:hypothetical protein
LACVPSASNPASPIFVLAYLVPFVALILLLWSFLTRRLPLSRAVRRCGRARRASPRGSGGPLPSAGMVVPCCGVLSPGGVHSWEPATGRA